MDIRGLREKKGLRQEDVAAEMEISTRQFQRWENGEVEVPRRKVDRLYYFLTKEDIIHEYKVTPDSESVFASDPALLELEKKIEAIKKSMRSTAMSKKPLSVELCQKNNDMLDELYRKLSDIKDMVINPQGYLGVDDTDNMTLLQKVQAWLRGDI